MTFYLNEHHSHQVENVEHAMLHCTAKPELEEQCHHFVVKVAAKEPRLHVVTPGNATAVLQALIFRRDTVCLIAKFAHQVFQLFDETLMVWLDVQGYCRFQNSWRS
jgi:hypothetical protein